MNKSKDWKEEMYRFVNRHPEGVREKDIKEEYEGKSRISHSTCVKHWKALKDSGRVRKTLADDGSLIYLTEKQFAFVRTKTEFYKATRFIDSLNRDNLVYGYDKEQKAAVSIFLDLAGKGNRESWQQLVDGYTNSGIIKYVSSLEMMGGRLLPGQKLAVVLTLEG